MSLENNKLTNGLPLTQPLSLSSLSSFKDSLMSSTKNTITSLTDGATDIFTNSGVSDSISNPSVSVSSPTSSDSFFSSISWQTIIIVILVLALLGLNIFTYLAKGTEEITSLIDNIFGPILKFFGYATLQTTKQVIETGAEGTKAGIDIVAGTAVSGINKIEQVATGKQAESSIQGGSATDISIDGWQENPLDKALYNAKQEYANQQVMPDEANSNIQYSGKAGYCYIGDSNGVRTCAKVGVNDTCMSGDIYPSNEICINPNLRV
jgi:hypothetical protein